MRLTQTHIQFLVSRRAPAPAWFRRVPNFRADRTWPTIDDVINAHASVKMTDGERSAHNTLVILRSARRRGRDHLIGWLQSMAESPSCSDNPKRRAGYCRKWLNKIEGVQK